MKINFSHIPQIKNTFANKSNLRFNNSLTTDVFEGNNVSFGRKSEQSPKEILIQHKGFSESQADIILSIGNISLANEIVLLMKNGHDFNSAIDKIVKNNFLPNTNDFIRYQNLSTDCELDIIDRISVVTYELNDKQLERYKEIKGKFTQQNEAILAVKFDLSDEEITHYLSIKNFYTLPPDELMICIKENFNDSQLARFVELKNRKKSFEGETVRKKEEQQAYPIRYIIACIKDDKSDEDIEREDRIIELTRKGYSTKHILKLLKLSQEKYNNYMQFVSGGEWNDQSYKQACLGPSAYAKYREFLKKEKEDIAYGMAKLDSVQYARYLELLSQNNDKYISLWIANFNSEQYERFKMYLTKGESLEIALNIAKPPTFNYAKYKSLISSNMNSALAMRHAMLNDEQSCRYNFLSAKYNEYNFSHMIATLNEEDFKQFEKLYDELRCVSLANRRVYNSPYSDAYYLARDTNLHSLTPEFLEKLPDDFWYKINTGSEKETHEIIQKAIAELLLEQRGEDNSLNLTPIETLQSCPNVVCGENKGDFKSTSFKPFEVNLSSGLINQKPILVVKDKNSDNQYISYNGAIAKVKPIQNQDGSQFEVWGNLLPQKQGTILAQATDEFVFNLFDVNGNCIIGQNASEFDVKNKTDEEIEKYYSNKLIKLKENNNLNAKEILKLMPKNCMLTISPYIQGADFSYAIVCEWFSKDNNRWQMEIHSQDSKWNNDEKWIFRLHKQTEYGRQYFQFVDNKDGFNFNGGTLDGNAHIKIPTPLEEDDLLNNVEFQTIIKQISIQQYKDFEIDKIAKDLKVRGCNNEEKIQNIIDHCLTHPLTFARYKDVILKLRASLGMIELV